MSTLHLKYFKWEVWSLGKCLGVFWLEVKIFCSDFAHLLFGSTFEFYGSRIFNVYRFFVPLGHSDRNGVDRIRI